MNAKPPTLPSARADATPTYARTALSVGLLAVLYLWVFPYHQQINNPNENVRVYMTVAMVDDHTFAINRIERDWGYTNDKSVRQVPLVEALDKRLAPPDFLKTLVPPDMVDRVERGIARYGARTLESEAAWRTNAALRADALLHNACIMRVALLYSSKAPGSSYMGAPAYWLLTHLTHRDSHPLTPAQIRAHHKPPLDRAVIIYVLRLFSNVLPALVFAWFWHRFLGARTRFPALREAVFFSTMAGSLLFAYSEMYASHAQNAFAAMGGLMAIAAVRDRDRIAKDARVATRWSLGLMFAAGLFGAAATMFEYPAAIATGVIAMLILATGVELRPAGAFGAIGFAIFAMKAFTLHQKAVALLLLAIAAVAYALTLTQRSVARLAAAGLGAVLPTALTLYYHARCFGDPFKPGYSYLENPTFHAETSQGFFGATAFSWESGIRLWLDPAFGMIPMTAIFVAAVIGFGAYFSWTPPGRAKWPVRGAIAALAIFCVVKAAGVAEALKSGAWNAAASEHASWIAFAVLVLIALAAVFVPKPTRADVGLGAGMLLICILLSRLIGAMNNWRGGWEVGPRYLATLAPILGLASLAGLDAIASRSDVHRRITTVFAAGATVVAMLLSGIPSAYFPHIPTEFVSPLFELFVPVLRAGLAPHNAGQFLFHWQGTHSMVPFFVVAAVVALIVLRGDERRPLAIAAHVLGGVALAMVLLAPFGAAAKYENMGVTRFVKGVWEPHLPDEHAAARPGVATRPAAETPEVLRERARRMAESGDSNNAFETFRRAAARTR